MDCSDRVNHSYKDGILVSRYKHFCIVAFLCFMMKC